MKGKNDFMKECWRRQAGHIIKNFKKRGIDGVYCENSADAVREICRMIPAGSLVGLGGSETILESGLVDSLRQMDIRLLDRYREGVSKEEVGRMRRQGLASDVFVMSSNAVTADGKLVNMDGTGNRVAALIFGPGKVIVMAGMNKVAADVDAAVARVRNTAAAGEQPARRRRHALLPYRLLPGPVLPAAAPHLLPARGHRGQHDPRPRHRGPGRRVPGLLSGAWQAANCASAP